IRARDPQATVVVYPCDHFVYSESRFLQLVQRAVWTVEWLPDRLVLLGIAPDHLQLDYGWIRPGEKLDTSNNYRISAVRSFLEHPTVAQDDAALAEGRSGTPMSLQPRQQHYGKSAGGVARP